MPSISYTGKIVRIVYNVVISFEVCCGCNERSDTKSPTMGLEDVIFDRHHVQQHHIHTFQCFRIHLRACMRSNRWSPGFRACICGPPDSGRSGNPGLREDGGSPANAKQYCAELPQFYGVRLASRAEPPKIHELGLAYCAELPQFYSVRRASGAELPQIHDCEHAYCAELPQFYDNGLQEARADTQAPSANMKEAWRENATLMSK